MAILRERIAKEQDLDIFKEFAKQLDDLLATNERRLQSRQIGSSPLP
jgi:hypothetical protein